MFWAHRFFRTLFAVSSARLYFRKINRNILWNAKVFPLFFNFSHLPPNYSAKMIPTVNHNDHRVSDDIITLIGRWQMMISWQHVTCQVRRLKLIKYVRFFWGRFFADRWKRYYLIDSNQNPIGNPTKITLKTNQITHKSLSRTGRQVFSHEF